MTGAQATSVVFPVLDTVTTTLNFFDGRVPENNYRWTGSNESERPMNLLPPDSHEVLVHDLRALSVTERVHMGLTLEKAGFEIVQGWGPFGEGMEAAWLQGKWNDDSWITDEYYSCVKRNGADLFSMVKTYTDTCSLTGCSAISGQHRRLQYLTILFAREPVRMPTMAESRSLQPRLVFIF